MVDARLRLATSVLALFAAGLSAAVAQAPGYREQPEVLTRPPAATAPAPDDRLDRLAKVLGRKPPRLALFWDADLSEETHSSYRSVTTVTDSAGHGSRELRIASGEERVKEAAPPMDRTEVYVETRIKEHLGAAGVSFVSAAMATRLAALQDSSEKPDRNKAEMKGLTGNADYLLKIEPHFAGAAGAPSEYRVTLTSLSTSQLLVDFMTDAKPQGPAPKKYVATSRGFELAKESAPTLEDQARELSMQIADRMATALARPAAR